MEDKKTAGRRAFCGINEYFYIVQESPVSLCLLMVVVASLCSNMDPIIWPKMMQDLSQGDFFHHLVRAFRVNGIIGTWAENGIFLPIDMDFARRVPKT